MYALPLSSPNFDHLERFSKIEEAAGRVYIHECYVNDLQAMSLPGIPIHSDPFFVYTGYKGALSNLMKLLAQWSNHEDAYCLHTCNQMVSQFCFDVFVYRS